MYIVRIDNKTDFTRLEAEYTTKREARKTANVAYFAAGYNIEISIIGPDGNEIEEW